MEWSRELNPYFNVIPTFGCVCVRVLFFFPKAFSVMDLQTKIRIYKWLHLVCCVFLAGIRKPICYLMRAFLSLTLLCFHLQTVHLGGNWKAQFSLVWLIQTVHRTQAVSTEWLVFIWMSACWVWFFQSPGLKIRFECGGRHKVEMKKLKLRTNQNSCKYQVTSPLALIATVTQK